MKKLIRFSVAFAAMVSLTVVSCKEKTETETTEETIIETPADNTATDMPAPPTNDTVPGVESGAGDEQVP